MSARHPALPRPRPAPSAAAQRPAPAAPPPLVRDGWAWASVAAVLPLLLASLGAPLGEPVAEDFDFLHRALLEHRHSLLDGGGSLAFWRPLSHQVYYGLVGPLMLSHPGLVAALHVALLALGSLLLYRTLRLGWPGHAAAAAAAFPLLAESTRTVITWPSHIVDVGPYLFSALALHEAAHRRMASSLGALLAALLCKEAAVVTALLLPWLPGVERVEWKTRVRWAVATGAVVAAWGVVYLAVRAHAGLALPHHLESDPALLATPLHARLAWAGWNSLRAIFSIALAPGRWDLAIGLATALVVAAALRELALSAGARARLRMNAGWLLWGLGWFALASATLAAIFPLWAPARSLFASIGLGIALAGLFDAAHPALLALLFVVKLEAVVLAPGPAREIVPVPEERGAFTDFARISRLQRLMKETREVLHRNFPRLPHGAMIGQHNMPIAAEYAFGGSKALQAWYRDTTLQWVRFEEFAFQPELDLKAIAQYQAYSSPQVVLVNTEAMRAMLGVEGLFNRVRDPREALRLMDRADSLQADRNAHGFLGKIAGVRAIGLTRLGDFDAAEREASRALALWPPSPDARMVLAACAMRRGDLARAEATLETLVVIQPGNRDAIDLLDRVRADLGTQEKRGPR